MNRVAGQNFSAGQTVPIGGPVLVLDDQDAFSVSLGRSFRELGLSTWLSTSLQQARLTCAASAPSLIVTELRIDGQWAFDFIDDLRAANTRCRVVIATVYPSVATAVRAARLGLEYVAKPVTARAILDMLGSGQPSSPGADGPAWPSLDRTIWEYINQVFLTAGTMSEAARRMGLDRRSLRRMLAKYPPAR
jgi:two-component system response regulator RegA